MSEIFGYSGNDGRHWFPSDVYNDAVIEHIKDPEGGTSVDLPTAIPSPFARLDLVRIAFENIGRTPDLKMAEAEGDVIAGAEDELLVSKTLDFLELFYHYNQPGVRPHIKLVQWNIEKELALLKADPDQAAYGDALSLYVDQDKAAYNFDLAGNIYIVKYKLEVIGCTSPVTLFCPAAVDFDHLDIAIGSIKLFGASRPLYERDPKFQEFVYYYFKKYPVIAMKMPAVAAYLEANKDLLQRRRTPAFNEVYERIKLVREYPERWEQDFQVISTSALGEILVFGLNGLSVPLLGLNTEIDEHRRSEHHSSTVASLREKARRSGFVIASEKTQTEDKPLVLTRNVDGAIHYIEGNWNNNILPKYISRVPLVDRQLPGYEINYPHLLIGDFLEPVLVRVVYPLNPRFFNGNFKISAGQRLKGYLLPLKLSFFDYFDAADLLSEGEAKPKIEMEQTVGDAVRVRLAIPIAAGRYIHYERTYHQLAVPPAVGKLEEENKGLIVEQQTGLTLFPFIRAKIADLKAFYRVQLIDRDLDGPLEHSEYTLKFFADGETGNRALNATEHRRGNKKTDMVGTTYYVLDEDFDFMQLQSGLAAAIIIPKWPIFHEGSVRFDFAIDFGTTNTHIEYRTSENNKPVAFDIGDGDDVQIATLFDPDNVTDDFAGTGALAIRECINEQFVPARIGKGISEFSFPQRTVLAKNERIASNETITLADYNIPFIYEKLSFRYNSNFETDLKWSKHNVANFNKVRSFFEELIFLIRNKVLMNKGKLEDTTITWFYPTSMQPSRIGNLGELWKQVIRKYMPEKVAANIRSLPESLAPFFYYKLSKNIPGGNATPAVSIDIGGGTTDVVVFKDNNPLYLTSFKFAANTLFGDPFATIRFEEGGILGKHLQHFRKELELSKYGGIFNALEQVIRLNKSADINAFLFSLENNPAIDDKNLFSYDERLNNDAHLKLVFLYFYAAIIYHVAYWMKTAGVKTLPNHLFFSGTGSKVLRIISAKQDYIEDLSVRIFEAVYGQKFTVRLKIITNRDIPKEATCKGGLLSLGQPLEFDMKKARNILNYSDHGPTMNRLRYEEVTAGVKAAVLSDVREFNKLFLALNDDEFFYDYFGVSPSSFIYFKEHINDYLDDRLGDGIAFNLSLDSEEVKDRSIEETLFFLPLIGTIYEMTNNLAELEKDKI